MEKKGLLSIYDLSAKEIKTLLSKAFELKKSFDVFIKRRISFISPVIVGSRKIFS
jgi:ornithine carbamoyltransferase